MRVSPLSNAYCFRCAILATGYASAVLVAGCGAPPDKETVRCSIQVTSAARNVVATYLEEGNSVDFDNVEVNELRKKLRGAPKAGPIVPDESYIGDPFDPNPLEGCELTLAKAKGGFLTYRVGKLRVQRTADGFMVISRGPDRDFDIPTLTRDRTYNALYREFGYDPTNGVSSGGDICSFSSIPSLEGTLK